MTHYILKWHVISGRRIYYVHDLHAKYRPVVRLGPNEVSAATTSAFKEIYSVNSWYTKHEWYTAFTGFHTPSMTFARALSKSQMRSQWEGTFNTITKKAISKVNENLPLVFGDSWDILDKGEKNEFIQCLEIYMQSTRLIADLPLIKIVGRWIPHPVCIRAFRGWDMLLGYASRAVENNRGSSPAGSKIIFGDVLATIDKGNSLSDFDIKNEAGGFTVAGTDTSAVIMSYLVYAVLSRPNLQKKLEEEAAMLTKGFQDADVEKLRWLNATISEMNRLYAAAQGAFPGRAPKGGAVVEGFAIPEGTTISCQSYTMHRKEELFENALTFKPERWCPESEMSTDAKAV
ncbi:hypothetical protein FDECE_14518 [Fusarium decemcellulare]|nr:hypothetical protein FDECE_14518 [Fusarium decemcellulare]